MASSTRDRAMTPRAIRSLGERASPGGVCPNVRPVDRAKRMSPSKGVWTGGMALGKAAEAIRASFPRSTLERGMSVATNAKVV